MKNCQLLATVTFFAALVASALPGLSFAQAPVAVGKGSYASFPPASAGGAAAEMAARKFPLVDRGDRPIPTNKLWTHLLEGKAQGSLWMYPWRVDPRESGLEMYLPLAWNSRGSDPECDVPLRVGGEGFRSRGLLVKDWGDWTLSFRLPKSATEYLDVTVGEGMPVVWIEAQGVRLTVDAGREAKCAPAGDGILTIAAAGRLYGLFAPPGTRLNTASGRVTVVAPPGKSFLAIAALKQPKDVRAFAQCAYSIPRASRMDWSYDARAGKVLTTWTVKTEPLVAGKPDMVIQGWLPHYWRDATTETKLGGPEYLTPRGPLRTSAGNRFQWVYDFDGFLPNLPAPQAASGFDRARMERLLEYCANDPKYGDDSYWGGKDLLRFAQYLQMARELKSPVYSRLRELSKKSLSDWLTCTPGEKAHYFTRYANWHALIGIKESYDSARFNDQHFHLGYFTLSAALLGMEDRQFLADYGPMLRLVAKQYANWDRGDSRFPFMRTFDIWAGHSWAGGLGSPGGNNQESSSEAMQSWIGLYLLGAMLDDADMTAAGAMGYAIESRAVMEYWFDQHQDILPPAYGHPVVGVLWSGGQVYGTYFSGDPGWVYGIQCLPQSPGLDYLVRDPDFAKKAFRMALVARKAKEGSDDLAAMGDLGNVLLAQAALVDPPWAAQEFDRLWKADSPIVQKHMGAGATYYNAHSYAALGRRVWTVHLSLPTAAVYYNAATKVVSFAAYNPKSRPVTVVATRGDRVLGEFVAPPRQLICVHKLEPAIATSTTKEP